MRHSWLLTALSVALVSAGLIAWGDEPAQPAPSAAVEPLCPVSGTPASKEVSVTYRGKPVLFCCEGCPGQFESARESYVAKVHHQWLVTGQIAQVACPVSGQPIDAEVTHQVAGAQVAFCCTKCRDAVAQAADPVERVFRDFDRAFSLQTHCVICESPINPAMSVTHEGKKVYFACGGCAQWFAKHPEDYLAKLPQFVADAQQ